VIVRLDYIFFLIINIIKFLSIGISKKSLSHCNIVIVFEHFSFFNIRLIRNAANLKTNLLK